MKTKKTLPSYTSQNFLGKIVQIEVEGKPTKKIEIKAKDLYQHFLNTTCKVGDEITLYITSKRPKRSLMQNNYLFLYLSLISLSSGHTVKQLEAWAVGKFLTKGITEVFGDKVRVTDKHRELNISEFCEFLARIEEDTEIPLPDTEPFLVPLSYEEYQALKDEQKAVYSKLVMKAKLST